MLNRPQCEGRSRKPGPGKTGATVGRIPNASSIHCRSGRLSVGNKVVSRFAERQRSLEIQLGRRIENPQALFLFDINGSVLAPTVANMKATIPGFSDYWLWPNDILRHYFRTRLWELGCSAGVLELAMGHLGKSQTPDTHFSMQPISATSQPVTPYINQLLDELGF